MKKFRVGNGYDVHRLAEGLQLTLGGVKIEHDKGCVAHSDGDAVIHALCDALLGAAALGDIGKHFPDTSDEFKGIDSRILLRRTASLLRQKGWQIGNVDCTIVLQRPKVAPYIEQMRQEMANAMEIDTDEVAVKATTTEKLGFTGREEGVAAYAVALIFHASVDSARPIRFRTTEPILHGRSDSARAIPTTHGTIRVQALTPDV